MKSAAYRQWIFWGWFAFSSLVYCWLLLGPFGGLFRNLFLRVGILGIFVAISVLILWKTWDGYQVWTATLSSVIGYTVIYKIAAFLPGINTYPFTLTWSEGSAYYFASAYVSERLYGMKVALPLLNPSRHLLMAAPFAIHDLPIWVHRAWEVVLWLFFTLAAVYLLVKRFGIIDRLRRWVYFGWVFLYFFQGPIYYFLLISIIPILWGFDARKFYRTLLLVLIGSAWAGISRVNWIPVPALLAATFYLFEVSVVSQNWWRYMVKPLIWDASGIAVGLLAWFGYAQISGQPVENFGVYFTSNLLWYRLLPNATYAGGVILMSMLASLPLVSIIAIQAYRQGFNFHMLRRLGIVSILLVLFAGGLIVSTKIGGGNNIHNLDAYLLILLVTASYLHLNQARPDFKFPKRTGLERYEKIFITLAVMIPILFVLQGGRPIKTRNPSKVEDALAVIQEYSSQTVSEGGKVLFIAERQLLTFGELQNIPLIPEYERLDLMEMVMGGNEQYLAEFRQRIENQEYALIISEPLKIKYQGRTNQFGDENDVYVAQVSTHVLCHYKPDKTIENFPIQFLIPKQPEDICS